MTVYTVGHSTRSFEELVNMLKAHKVAQIADVRTIPRSRRNPQFNKEALSVELPSLGMSYLHMPQLGGLRKSRPDSLNTAWRNESFRGYADHMDTPDFKQALDELLDLATESPTAIMCAEALPWRCHRSLIADALATCGVAVDHIFSETSSKLHTPTPFLKVDSDGRLRYAE